jgi:hypothetical protein
MKGVVCLILSKGTAPELSSRSMRFPFAMEYSVLRRDGMMNFHDQVRHVILSAAKDLRGR